MGKKQTMRSALISYILTIRNQLSNFVTTDFNRYCMIFFAMDEQGGDLYTGDILPEIGKGEGFHTFFCSSGRCHRTKHPVIVQGGIADWMINQTNSEKMSPKFIEKSNTV